jgi:hypothetical protein
MHNLNMTEAQTIHCAAQPAQQIEGIYCHCSVAQTARGSADMQFCSCACAAVAAAAAAIVAATTAVAVHIPAVFSCTSTPTTMYSHTVQQNNASNNLPCITTYVFNNNIVRIRIRESTHFSWLKRLPVIALINTTACEPNQP